MGTFPASPSLPAVTTATEVDPDFLNTFVDNINAIGDALIALMNGVADGNIDIDALKGIKWGGVLKINFAGGDIVIDDGVQITGALDVTGALTIGSLTGNFNVVGNIDSTGTLTVDTIDDSGGAEITINEDVVLAVGKDITVQDLNVNAIHVRTLAQINVHDSMEFSAGKYIEVPTLKVDTIDVRLGTEIDILDDVVIAAGKTLEIGTPPNYTVSNLNADRAFDCDTVAIAELADVVGTIIDDLISMGLFA